MCSKEATVKWMRRNALMVATLSAVILGIALGFAMRSCDPSENVVTWISIWGELFLRMIKVVILPLMVCCLVIGVASMEGCSQSGKLGVVTLTYIFLTQFISTSIGAIFVSLIRPGAGFGDDPPDGTVTGDTSYTNVFTDMMRNMFPDNIIRACIQSAYTDVQEELYDLTNNATENGHPRNDSLGKISRSVSVKYRNGMNIIGVVTFSVALGIAVCVSKEAGQPLLRFIRSLNHVITKLMNAIIMYSPIGILSLTASAIIKVDELEDALQAVGLLVGTVVAGCMVHQLVVLPLIFAVVCKKNPYTYFLGILDAYFGGLAPASSAVAMPYLLRACPEKFGIDKRVAQFVIPIEVTLNKDGSALFIYVATLFVAQSYSITLATGQQVALVFLLTVIVPAVAVVPSSSIVVLLMVSSAFGIPVDERMGILMSVEWLTDRIRTGTNIASHGYGCAIVDDICRKHLKILDPDGKAHSQAVDTSDNEDDIKYDEEKHTFKSTTAV